MLNELTRACCDGSVEKLLCHLIRSEKLSEDDLLELKRIAEASDEEPTSGKEKS